jgi:predicted DNA-binding transcriptional regulator AlpA
MAQMIQTAAAVPANSSGGELWTHPETAAFLRIPVSTLYQLNARKAGPPSSKVGRHRRYDPAEVRAWLITQRAAA